MTETYKRIYNNQDVIKMLKMVESHKYLGVLKVEGSKHSVKRLRIRKGSYRMIRVIFKTKLNARNGIEAINT